MVLSWVNLSLTCHALADQFGSTAIHLAARENHKTVLEHLLPPLKTTVDTEDYEGKTPLWKAAFNGSVDCISILLAHGANPDHRR